MPKKKKQTEEKVLATVIETKEAIALQRAVAAELECEDKDLEEIIDEDTADNDGE